MILFFLIITCVYILFTLILLIGWESIPLFERTFSGQPETSVSIIIPVRNEEGNIEKLLYDIKAQDYPAHLLEIIIVNDHSLDKTEEKVFQWSERCSYPVKLINIANEFKDNANKKRAIEAGINASKGSLIVTTDGDCRVGIQWIGTLVEFFQVHSCKMICGPVFIKNKGSIFGEMQMIEFSSLIGSGAASLKFGNPSMCNGANLAYEREVFFEVEGFKGNEQVASGDDEFLMHKIHHKYPHKVFFIKSRDAIVWTNPQKTLGIFINQRIRWSSKWKSYQSQTPKILAFFVLAYNLSLLLGAFLCFLGKIEPILFLEQFLFKILAEFVFLRRIVILSENKINIISFLILELIYPFYVVTVAFAGIRGKYNWKDRQILIKN